MLDENNLLGRVVSAFWASFKSLKNRIRRGFTLAEVLIALAIVGILSVLILPVITTRAQNKSFALAYESEVKQILNSLSGLHVLENVPDIKNTMMFVEAESEDFAASSGVYLKKYMNVAKYCGNTPGECFASHYYEYVDNDKVDFDMSRVKGACAVLKNGMSICLKPKVGSGDIEGWIDLNGKKGPNVKGKDLRDFNIDTNEHVAYSEENPLDVIMPEAVTDDESSGPEVKDVTACIKDPYSKACCDSVSASAFSPGHYCCPWYASATSSEKYKNCYGERQSEEDKNCDNKTITGPSDSCCRQNGGTKDDPKCCSATDTTAYCCNTVNGSTEACCKKGIDRAEGYNVINLTAENKCCAYTSIKNAYKTLCMEPCQIDSGKTNWREDVNADAAWKTNNVASQQCCDYYTRRQGILKPEDRCCMFDNIQDRSTNPLTAMNCCRKQEFPAVEGSADLCCTWRFSKADYNNVWWFKEHDYDTTSTISTKNIVGNFDSCCDYALNKIKPASNGSESAITSPWSNATIKTRVWKNCCTLGDITSEKYGAACCHYMITDSSSKYRGEENLKEGKPLRECCRYDEFKNSPYCCQSIVDGIVFRGTDTGIQGDWSAQCCMPNNIYTHENGSNIPSAECCIDAGANIIGENSSTKWAQTVNPNRYSGCCNIGDTIYDGTVTSGSRGQKMKKINKWQKNCCTYSKGANNAGRALYDNDTDYANGCCSKASDFLYKWNSSASTQQNVDCCMSYGSASDTSTSRSHHDELWYSSCCSSTTDAKNSKGGSGTTLGSKEFYIKDSGCCKFVKWDLGNSVASNNINNGCCGAKNAKTNITLKESNDEDWLNNCCEFEDDYAGRSGKGISDGPNKNKTITGFELYRDRCCNNAQSTAQDGFHKSPYGGTVKNPNDKHTWTKNSGNTFSEGCCNPNIADHATNPVSPSQECCNAFFARSSLHKDRDNKNLSENYRGECCKMYGGDGEGESGFFSQTTKRTAIQFTCPEMWICGAKATNNISNDDPSINESGNNVGYGLPICCEQSVAKNNEQVWKDGCCRYPKLYNTNVEYRNNCCKANTDYTRENRSEKNNGPTDNNQEFCCDPDIAANKTGTASGGYDPKGVPNVNCCKYFKSSSGGNNFTRNNEYFSKQSRTVALSKNYQIECCKQSSGDYNSDTDYCPSTCSIRWETAERYNKDKNWNAINFSGCCKSVYNKTTVTSNFGIKGNAFSTINFWKNNCCKYVGTSASDINKYYGYVNSSKTEKGHEKYRAACCNGDYTLKDNSSNTALQTRCCEPKHGKTLSQMEGTNAPKVACCTAFKNNSWKDFDGVTLSHAYRVACCKQGVCPDETDAESCFVRYESGNSANYNLPTCCKHLAIGTYNDPVSNGVVYYSKGVDWIYKNDDNWKNTCCSWNAVVGKDEATTQSKIGLTNTQYKQYCCMVENGSDGGVRTSGTTVVNDERCCNYSVDFANNSSQFCCNEKLKIDKASSEWQRTDANMDNFRNACCMKTTSSEGTHKFDGNQYCTCTGLLNKLSTGNDSGSFYSYMSGKDTGSTQTRGEVCCKDLYSKSLYSGTTNNNNDKWQRACCFLAKGDKTHYIGGDGNFRTHCCTNSVGSDGTIKYPKSTSEADSYDAVCCNYVQDFDNNSSSFCCKTKRNSENGTANEWKRTDGSMTDFRKACCNKTTSSTGTHKFNGDQYCTCDGLFTKKGQASLSTYFANNDTEAKGNLGVTCCSDLYKNHNRGKEGNANNDNKWKQTCCKYTAAGNIANTSNIVGYDTNFVSACCTGGAAASGVVIVQSGTDAINDYRCCDFSPDGNAATNASDFCCAERASSDTTNHPAGQNWQAYDNSSDAYRNVCCAKTDGKGYCNCMGLYTDPTVGDSSTSLYQKLQELELTGVCCVNLMDKKVGSEDVTKKNIWKDACCRPISDGELFGETYQYNTTSELWKNSCCDYPNYYTSNGNYRTKCCNGERTRRNPDGSGIRTGNENFCCIPTASATATTITTDTNPGLPNTECCKYFKSTAGGNNFTRNNEYFLVKNKQTIALSEDYKLACCKQSSGNLNSDTDYCPSGSCTLRWKAGVIGGKDNTWKQYNFSGCCKSVYNLKKPNTNGSEGTTNWNQDNLWKNNCCNYVFDSTQTYSSEITLAQITSGANSIKTYYGNVSAFRSSCCNGSDGGKGETYSATGGSTNFCCNPSNAAPTEGCCKAFQKNNWKDFDGNNLPNYDQYRTYCCNQYGVCGNDEDSCRIRGLTGNPDRYNLPTCCSVLAKTWENGTQTNTIWKASESVWKQKCCSQAKNKVASTIGLADDNEFSSICCVAGSTKSDGSVITASGTVQDKRCCNYSTDSAGLGSTTLEGNANSFCCGEYTGIAGKPKSGWAITDKAAGDLYRKQCCINLGGAGTTTAQKNNITKYCTCDMVFDNIYYDNTSNLTSYLTTKIDNVAIGNICCKNLKSKKSENHWRQVCCRYAKNDAEILTDDEFGQNCCVNGAVGSTNYGKAANGQIINPKDSTDANKYDGRCCNYSVSNDTELSTNASSFCCAKYSLVSEGSSQTKMANGTWNVTDQPSSDKYRQKCCLKKYNDQLYCTCNDIYTNGNYTLEQMLTYFTSNSLGTTCCANLNGKKGELNWRKTCCRFAKDDLGKQSTDTSRILSDTDFSSNCCAPSGPAANGEIINPKDQTDANKYDGRCCNFDGNNVNVSTNASQYCCDRRGAAQSSSEPWGETALGWQTSDPTPDDQTSSSWKYRLACGFETCEYQYDNNENPSLSADCCKLLSTQTSRGIDKARWKKACCGLSKTDSSAIGLPTQGANSRSFKEVCCDANRPYLYGTTTNDSRCCSNANATTAYNAQNTGGENYYCCAKVADNDLRSKGCCSSEGTKFGSSGNVNIANCCTYSSEVTATKYCCDLKAGKEDVRASNCCKAEGKRVDGTEAGADEKNCCTYDGNKAEAATEFCCKQKAIANIDTANHWKETDNYTQSSNKFRYNCCENFGKIYDYGVINLDGTNTYNLNYCSCEYKYSKLNPAEIPANRVTDPDGQMSAECCKSTAAYKGANKWRGACCPRSSILSDIGSSDFLANCCTQDQEGFRYKGFDEDTRELTTGFDANCCKYNNIGVSTRAHISCCSKISVDEDWPSHMDGQMSTYREKCCKESSQYCTCAGLYKYHYEPSFRAEMADTGKCCNVLANLTNPDTTKTYKEDENWKKVCCGALRNENTTISPANIGLTTGNFKSVCCVSSGEPYVYTNSIVDLEDQYFDARCCSNAISSTSYNDHTVGGGNNLCCSGFTNRKIVTGENARISAGCCSSEGKDLSTTNLNCCSYKGTDGTYKDNNGNAVSDDAAATGCCNVNQFNSTYPSEKFTVPSEVKDSCCNVKSTGSIRNYEYNSNLNINFGCCTWRKNKNIFDRDKNAFADTTSVDLCCQFWGASQFKEGTTEHYPGYDQDTYNERCVNKNDTDLASCQYMYSKKPGSGAADALSEEVFKEVFNPNSSCCQQPQMKDKPECLTACQRFYMGRDDDGLTEQGRNECCLEEDPWDTLVQESNTGLWERLLELFSYSKDKDLNTQKDELWASRCCLRPVYDENVAGDDFFIDGSYSESGRVEMCCAKRYDEEAKVYFYNYSRWNNGEPPTACAGDGEENICSVYKDAAKGWYCGPEKCSVFTAEYCSESNWSNFNDDTKAICRDCGHDHDPQDPQDPCSTFTPEYCSNSWDRLNDNYKERCCQCSFKKPINDDDIDLCSYTIETKDCKLEGTFDLDEYGRFHMGVLSLTDVCKSDYSTEKFYISANMYDYYKNKIPLDIEVGILSELWEAGEVIYDAESTQYIVADMKINVTGLCADQQGPVVRAGNSSGFTCTMNREFKKYDYENRYSNISTMCGYCRQKCLISGKLNYIESNTDTHYFVLDNLSISKNCESTYPNIMVGIKFTAVNDSDSSVNPIEFNFLPNVYPVEGEKISFSVSKIYSNLRDVQMYAGYVNDYGDVNVKCQSLKKAFFPSRGYENFYCGFDLIEQ